MQGLLEKIEADAAARLPLPAGRQPGQELARYKGFLKIETHRLKMLHRAGNVDATPATFNWTVALDTDGDGLLDDWETNGVWYNPTANSTCASGTAGCQFINLPAMGALPGTRNIFVQLDWMEDSCHSHRPSFAAIKKVVDAFAAVVPPVRLRVDMGPDSPLDYTNYPTSFTTWGALSKARALTHYSQLGSVVGNQYN